MIAPDPWILKCASGREFIVYAEDQFIAVERFGKIMPDEKILSTALHVEGPTIAHVDNRRAPGA